MKIESLSVTNVKGAREIYILANPVCNELGGKNYQGKSSVLDSIVLALGGKRAIPKDPITHGGDRAEVVLETDDFVVNRLITPDKDGKGYDTRLKVMSKGVGDFKQRDLDALLGGFAFDPLAFARLKSADQIAQLKVLAGPEVCAELNRLGSEIEQWEQERLLAGREIKAIGDIKPVDPVEAVDAAALVKERQAILDHNQAQAARAKAIDEAQEAADKAASKVAAAREALKQALAEEKDARAALDALPLAEEPQDTAKLDEKLGRLNEINEKAAAYKAYLVRVEKHRSQQAWHEEAGEKIKALRKQRQETFAAAALPLPGLRYDDGAQELYFQDTPFSQLSSAEQYRVSAAIGMASLPPLTSDRPHLRIMIIRDGSLLDDGSFEEIKALAEEYGCQLWVETVGEGHGDAILIEEGRTVSLESWLAKRAAEREARKAA